MSSSTNSTTTNNSTTNTSAPRCHHAAGWLVAAPLALTLALSACGPLYHAEGIDPDDPAEPACLGEPGLPGVPGGPGGTINLRYSSLQGSVAQLKAALRVEGGAGGLPGPYGEPAPPPEARAEGILGPQGAAGQAQLDQVSGLTFDQTGIADDDALHASAGNLYIKTKTLDAGPLRVKRLTVAPGVTLKLSGGWIIEADEVLVGPGAAIIVSDLGQKTHNVLGNTVGDKGGALVLRARKLELLGDLVLSGRPGEPEQAGNAGGQLELELGELHLGPTSVIDVGGGAGGQGNAGRSCR